MSIYFDNASTSYPKPECVFEAMRYYCKNIGANAGRSAHRRSVHASKLVFETRELVAELIGAKDSSRIIFTQNATEALNLSILGCGLKRGDHIITSSIEHNSVMRPLKFLEKERKILIDMIKCDKNGMLDPSDIESKITKKTKLITINHASNVVGTILPIRAIGQIAYSHNIPFLVDAAQTIGCIPLDINENHIDLLAFSGHKALLGPQGVGCLYIRKGIKIYPLKYGGTGSYSESEMQPDFLPDRFESGTLNLPGISGLRKGIEFIKEKGITNIQKEMHALTAVLINRLSKIEKLTIYGTRDKTLQTGIVSFNINRKDPSEVGQLLDNEYDIAVRIGLHCSPQTHKTIGTFPNGTVRISLGSFNTIEDIDKLCEALCQITV